MVTRPSGLHGAGVRLAETGVCVRKSSIIWAKAARGSIRSSGKPCNDWGRNRLTKLDIPVSRHKGPRSAQRAAVPMCQLGARALPHVRA